MKHWLGAALICLATSALASPYFRLLNPDNPAVSAGVFIDPKDTGQTSVGKSVALVTHSTRDGCVLPSLICEDWSPLTSGLSVNAGRLLWTVGPSMNLSPTVKRLLLRGVNATTEPDDWGPLKKLLAPSDSPVSVAFGPALGVSPVQHGTIVPLNEWQGRFKIFAGTAWKF